MESLQNNFNQLQENLGLDGAIKEVSKMIDKQGVKTYKQLNEAIEEELILLEVD